MENQEARFLQQMQQVEALIEEVEHCTDEKARYAAQDLMRAVLDLHRAAFSRVCELLAHAGEPGKKLLQDCSADELVGNVLLLHGLHPQDLRARVLAALEKVRPHLRSHGGNVELLGVIGSAVHLRLQGSCHGCGSSTATVKSLIEQAIYDAAPEVAAIEILSPEPPAALVELGVLPQRDRAGYSPEPTMAKV